MCPSSNSHKSMNILPNKLIFGHSIATKVYFKKYFKDKNFEIVWPYYGPKLQKVAFLTPFSIFYGKINTALRNYASTLKMVIKWPLSQYLGPLEAGFFI